VWVISWAKVDIFLPIVVRKTGFYLSMANEIISKYQGAAVIISRRL
jgi:hypothetical protein